MRIISGRLKSFRFNPPKGFNSRPTTDFAKESLFNLLSHRMSLVDLDILDLCAGTGNISFEFASREAGRITAVDSNFKCVRFINMMAKKYEVGEDLSVIKSDAVKYLKATPNNYDLIFADPPFDRDFHKDIVRTVFEEGVLNENGLLIIEHGRDTVLTELPNFIEMRKYGSVHFSFFGEK